MVLHLTHDPITHVPTSAPSTGPLRCEQAFTFILAHPGRPEEQETVRVPGIIVQGADPRFVEGYTWGRERSFSQIDDEQRPTAWLQVPDLVRFVLSLLDERAPDFVGDAPDVERIGGVVGFIAHCVQDFYGLHDRPAMAPDEAFCDIVPDGLDLDTHQPLSQRIRVPGCVIAGADPDFAMAYACGRDCYVDDVSRRFWPDGSPVEAGKDVELLPFSRSVKVRDITSHELIQMIRDETRHMQETQLTPVELAGLLFGYVAACVEAFHGLTCPTCGASVGCCECSEGAAHV